MNKKGQKLTKTKKAPLTPEGTSSLVSVLDTPEVEESVPLLPEDPKPLKKKVSKAESNLQKFRKAFDSDKTMDLLRFSDDDLLSNVRDYLSTQSIALNKAIECHGYPMGRLIEISGPEHSGKSSLIDHALAETQRRGGVGVLLEPEVSRDKTYSSRIGVNVDELILPQPKDGQLFTLEDTLSFVGKTADWWRTNDPGTPVTIAVDSIAAMPTKEDMERDAGQKKPGEAASIIKHTLRNMCQRIAGTRITLILVNQLYTRIGYKGWGDPRTEWGGSGIPYHASLRLRLDPGEKIKDKDGVVIGTVVRCLIKKSKVSGTTGTKCEFALLHGVGIDNSWTLFERLKREGYIGSTGAWSSMILPGSDGPVKWQGGHFGLLSLCQATPGLYEKLVAIYHSLPA